LKPAVKDVAASFGLRATFMPKPWSDAAGSGMHTHQVALLANGVNAFLDADAPYGLSTIGRRFAAGQLHHASGMTALLAPLVNSYKRLVPGYEAPVAGSWGRHNRSALIRVPTLATATATSFDDIGTRLELRLPDPACNPYLAFAGMLTAGLDGLDSELEIGPPMEELDHGVEFGPKLSVRPLPTALADALIALEDDDVITAALGSGLVAIYVAAKRLEWDSYRREVTPWERDTYFDQA
jgi:glutamine synthetase